MASPQAQTPTLTPVRRRVEWAVWLVAVGLLVAGGALQVVRYARDMPPALAGDRAASDRFLLVLGVTEPSATFEAVVDGLPLDEPVYLVVPGDHPARSGTFFGMSPIVWPRPFGLVACTATGGSQQVRFPLPAQPSGSTVAVLVWSPPPLQPDAPVVLTAPVGAEGTPIGPQLQLFTGQEGDIWTSFCSP